MMHPHTAVSPHNSQRGHREISPWSDGVVCVCVSHNLSLFIAFHPRSTRSSELSSNVGS